MPSLRTNEVRYKHVNSLTASCGCHGPVPSNFSLNLGLWGEVKDEIPAMWENEQEYENCH